MTRKALFLSILLLTACHHPGPAIKSYHLIFRYSPYITLSLPDGKVDVYNGEQIFQDTIRLGLVALQALDSAFQQHDIAGLQGINSYRLHQDVIIMPTPQTVFKVYQHDRLISETGVEDELKSSVFLYGVKKDVVALRDEVLQLLETNPDFQTILKKVRGYKHRPGKQPLSL